MKKRALLFGLAITLFSISAYAGQDVECTSVTIKNLHSLKHKDHEEKGALAGTSLTLKLSGDKYKII
jgi:hypothetical protein